MQARRAGRQGRKAEGGLGHWQQFASYVGLFFGPICTTFSTVFFAGSNFWFRVSFMSNKIRALGNSSTSLTLETIFDSSTLEILVEILSPFTNWRWLFFRKCDVFFRSPNLKKIYIPKTILSWKFIFPANYSILLLAGNLNFKLRIVFGIFFFEIWRSKKHIALSEKKPPLSS